MTVRLPFLLSLLFFTSAALAQTRLSFNEDSINQILYKYVDDEDPGLAVGIVKDGEIIYEHYIGYANLPHKVKVNDSTRFNIASTSKQFTALLLLQLSMDGKLDLEEDIRKYLPKLYPKVKSEIKIRHLINHTSGIRDYVFLYEMKNKHWWKQVGKGNKDVLRLLELQEALMFSPGTAYAYSNSNYIIMAQLISEVTGERFHDYSERWFKSLGMNETAFLKKYMAVIPNKADPYSDWGSADWLQFPMVTKFYADGSLYTTLKDQLLFEIAVQHAEKEGNELLLAGQQPIPNSEIKSYGFGVELDKRTGRNAIFHAGSTGSYNCQLDRFPTEALSIFIMTNNGKIICQHVADDIANLLLPGVEKTTEAYNKRYYEKRTTTSKPKIIGQYVSPEETLIQVSKQDGKIYWQRFDSNPFELTPEGNESYYFADQPSWKVVFYDEEMVLYESNGKTKTYMRSNEQTPTISDFAAFEGKYYSSELDMHVILKGKNEKQLEMQVSNAEGEIYEVKAINRNVLTASGYIIQVKRDQFDRPIDVLITLNERAKNNRFKKQTNLIFQPKIPIDNGSVQVSTIGSKDGETSDILLTKNLPNGNEVWSKRLGGSSYDKASSIMQLEDGYLIIGSTSSFGNGNYDLYAIKVDREGKLMWENTFGRFDNEYGNSTEKTSDGYLLKGTIQQCSSKDVLSRTGKTNVWFVYIDKNGKEIRNEILEEVSLN